MCFPGVKGNIFFFRNEGADLSLLCALHSLIRSSQQLYYHCSARWVKGVQWPEGKGFWTDTWLEAERLERAWKEAAVSSAGVSGLLLYVC